MDNRNNKAIILFDGVCNLCNSSVNFVIRHDKKNHFLFAPLQSEIGKKILVENYTYTTIFRLKKQLVKEKLLEYKCSICSLKEWLNQPISLQLDHINGIRNDHRLENLRFLCPNCHSQSETYAGRNKRKN